MRQTREEVGSCSVRVWSGGDGAPLLYLHGFEQHPGDAAFLNRLAQSFAVKAPEHPGFGHSSGLETMVDVLDMALHLRRFVEQWNAGPVDVIGHSLGGMFAAELAVIAPHLVRRLVLVDAYGLWLDETPLPDPFVMTPDALTAAKWHDPAQAAKEPSAFDAAIDGSLQVFRSVNLASATKFMWPIPDRGLARRARDIHARTLILHGESDRLVPSPYAAALSRIVPHSEHASLQDAGHLPMVEAEEAFSKAVLAFLT